MEDKIYQKKNAGRRLSVAEVEKFFKDIGLGSENERIKFKELIEATNKEEKQQIYEIRLSNNTRIDNGKLE